MSSIVRTVANSIYFFIFVFGLYIIMHGHLTPGGGFQGGAVVASAFALIMVAYGTERAMKFYDKDIFSMGESTGLLAFLGAAFVGITTAFFYNQLAGEGGLFGKEFTKAVINAGNLNSGGVIPIMNIAVGLEVLSGFGVILMSMIAFMKFRYEGDEGCGDAAAVNGGDE